MEIHEISAYGTSAEEFFGRLARWGTEVVLDVRLRNTSQLAGFTKRSDLAFFVTKISGARYAHDLLFAPSPEMLDGYLRGGGDWPAYARAYRAEMLRRDARAAFFARYGSAASVALVGTAAKGRRSHTEILLDILGGGLPDGGSNAVCLKAPSD